MDLNEKQQYEKLCRDLILKLCRDFNKHYDENHFQVAELKGPYGNRFYVSLGFSAPITINQYPNGTWNSETSDVIDETLDCIITLRNIEYPHTLCYHYHYKNGWKRI